LTYLFGRVSFTARRGVVSARAKPLNYGRKRLRKD
jgi:hypothetical protein